EFGVVVSGAGEMARWLKAWTFAEALGFQHRHQALTNACNSSSRESKVADFHRNTLSVGVDCTVLLSISSSVETPDPFQEASSTHAQGPEKGYLSIMIANQTLGCPGLYVKMPVSEGSVSLDVP
ncbi:hypothetical protein STEG23_001288, partial [Scotinomys teguina]